MSKTIVVVGGSAAGIAAVQDLVAGIESKRLQAKVVLVERRSHFFYKVGALRAAASAEFSEKVFAEYTNIFNGIKGGHQHEVVCDTLESVDKRCVSLRSGRKIEFDYLVLATGSVNRGPAGIAASTKQAGLAELQWHRENLERATNILVVGGGPVAIEFAGEISSFLSAGPDHKKKITLVHAGKKLLNDEWKDKLRNKLKAALEAAGVTVILDDRVDLTAEQLESQGKFSPTTVTTRGGKSIEADVVLMQIGNSVNTDYMRPLIAELGENAVVDEKTRLIKVSDALQLTAEGCGHIFAAGDVNSLPPNEKLYFRAAKMGSVAAKNILAMLTATGGVQPSALSKYSLPFSAIIVPVGPTDGATQLFGFVFGSWVTSFLKGGDLFVKKTIKGLYQTPA